MQLAGSAKPFTAQARFPADFVHPFLPIVMCFCHNLPLYIRIYSGLWLSFDSFWQVVGLDPQVISIKTSIKIAALSWKTALKWMFIWMIHICFMGCLYSYGCSMTAYSGAFLTD